MAKSLLTEELKTKIIEYIEGGCTFRDACRNARISEAVFHLWRSKGRAQKTGMYHEFAEAVIHARARYKKALLDTLNKEAKSDARLALEILSRRWPREWAKRVKNEIVGKDGQPLEIIQTLNSYYDKRVKNREAMGA